MSRGSSSTAHSIYALPVVPAASATNMDRDDKLEMRTRGGGGGGGGGGASEFRVRARFYAIRQVDGERAYDWYRRAVAAAVPCGFADDRPVADKFVTGLRPGLVADRLLGERADGLLMDLVATAMQAERTLRPPLPPPPPPTIPLIPPPPHTRPMPPPKTDHVLDEIREALKLYRYSSDAAGCATTAPDCGGDCLTSHINDDNHRSSYDVNNTFVGDTSSTTSLDGNAWNRIEKSPRQNETIGNKNKYFPLTCKSCCHLATSLLESFGKNTSSLFPYSWSNTNKNSEEYFGKDQGYHDDYNCYCSSLISNEYKDINYRSMSKSVKTNNCLSSKNFGCPKKMQCCVCDSDDKSFSQ